MDKRREVMVYGHNCPRCYPELRGLVRTADVNILTCETCGFTVHDRYLVAKQLSLEELAFNYMVLIRQVLLNTKSDYVKYSSPAETPQRQKRCTKELQRIERWIECSRLLEIVANLANTDVATFRVRVSKEIKDPDRYRWSSLFGKSVRPDTEHGHEPDKL